MEKKQPVGLSQRTASTNCHPFPQNISKFAQARRKAAKTTALELLGQMGLRFLEVVR